MRDMSHKLTPLVLTRPCSFLWQLSSTTSVFEWAVDSICSGMVEPASILDMDMCAFVHTLAVDFTGVCSGACGNYRLVSSVAWLGLLCQVYAL
mmetsp:Transcript_127068/g.406208  ORF Transcript_127068/g.406208 Transcript_127068/m.406208 type:complete len:93 (+) Transcript_127068:370-648(+)